MGSHGLFDAAPSNVEHVVYSLGVIAKERIDPHGDSSGGHTVKEVVDASA